MFLRSLVLVLFLVLPLMALAQDLPQPLSDTVSDFADLLPPEAEARVAAMIRKTRDETGVHIVVVTLDRISNYGAADLGIEAYAKRLFNTWGIGDATRNDGILMLVARDDRAARIALGSAYDPVYDGRATRVIDTAMLPEFRQDRYAQGIEAGVAGAVDRLVTPFVAKAGVTETSGFATAFNYMMLVPIAIVAGFFALVFRRSIGDQMARFKRCPTCGSVGLRRTREAVTAATAVAAGSGLLHETCPNCGTTRTEPYDIARRGRSSGQGGGSSGFGGGRSSGGGATGRW
ncbi:MAG: TPM domain-containing protein [Pseudomonadota bacterium]